MQMKTPRFQLAQRGSVQSRRQLVEIQEGGAGFCTFVPLAVGAYLVGFQLEQRLDGRLVLGRPFGSGVGRTSRHGWNKRCGKLLRGAGGDWWDWKDRLGG